MRTPFTVAGRDFIVQVSVGIAMANQYDTRSEKLLQDADVALYATKDAGGNDYTFFEPRLGKAYVDRLGLQAELSMALDTVSYSSSTSLSSSLSQGVPSASRLCCGGGHPRRGVTRTVDFLQVSDNSAIAVEIGAWVLGEAMQQLRGWRERIPAAAHLWTAVNVSTRQLASGDLVSAVSKAIDASGLEPESLHIELTESAVTDLVEWSMLVLTELKKLGAKLEINDFGTGYSSLAYLKQLPIDGVKMDRAFVEGLGSDGRDAVIIEAVVALAHALRLKVAAVVSRTVGSSSGSGRWMRLRTGLPVERPAAARRARAVAHQDVTEKRRSFNTAAACDTRSAKTSQAANPARRSNSSCRTPTTLIPRDDRKSRITERRDGRDDPSSRRP